MLLSQPEAESWHVPTGLLSTNGALCRMPMWKEDKKEGKERQALRQDELAVLTELFRTPFGIVCPTFAHRTLIHMQRSVMEAYRFGDVTFSERIEELQTQFGTAVVEYEKEETFVDGVQAFIRAFGQSNARDADMHFRVRLTMTQKPRLPEVRRPAKRKRSCPTRAVLPQFLPV